MAIIIGIDPGSRITGFGIIETGINNHKYITSGAIRTTPTASPLKQIFSELVELIRLYKPTEAAIEQVFVHMNINSALKLGQARGAAIVAVSQDDLKISEYSARQIKQAVVGYGNAEKSQVQHMVKLLLKIKTTIQADEADALAVALCHTNSANSRLKLLK